jgi:AraC-like DNA-binding protein
MTRLAGSFEYMRAHLNQPLRISTLCNLAGLSSSRFFELFKTATGDTPLNWFTRLRMNWASDLLVNSSWQVKQVAIQVGYEDSFYFSRVFTSVHGVSPSEYRKQRSLNQSKNDAVAGVR